MTKNNKSLSSIMGAVVGTILIIAALCMMYPDLNTESTQEPIDELYVEPNRSVDYNDIPGAGVGQILSI